MWVGTGLVKMLRLPALSGPYDFRPSWTMDLGRGWQWRSWPISAFYRGCPSFVSPDASVTHSREVSSKPQGRFDLPALGVDHDELRNVNGVAPSP